MWSNRSSFPKKRWEDTGDCEHRKLLSERITFPTATAVTAPNRFMKSAMSEQLCSFNKNCPMKSGIPSKELIELYRKFGQGKFGVVVTGAIMVNANEIEAPGNVIIGEKVDSAERKIAFREWTETGKEGGAVFLAQLFHPGERSSDYTGKQKFDPGTVSKEKLENLIEQFIYAGNYASLCGFDGVEIACAYNFALGSLITESMNKRTDDYGGSFENRNRALFKIIDGIREAVERNKNFVIGVKLSAYNLAFGFKEKEFATFLKQLESHGVDYVAITGGRFELLKEMSESEKSKLNQIDGAYKAIATTMKNKLSKAKIFMNGNFVTLSEMGDAVHQGWTSGISLGRPAAAEPDLPKKMLAGPVSGAVKSLVDASDFPTAQQVAGTQMWQYGSKSPVLDPSNPEHMEGFKECLAKHQETIKSAASDTPVIGYARFHP